MRVIHGIYLLFRLTNSIAMADSCAENIEQTKVFVRDSQHLSAQKEVVLDAELKEHQEMQRYHSFFPVLAFTLSLWNAIDKQRNEISALSAKAFGLSREIRHLENTIATVKDSSLPNLAADKKASVAGTLSCLSPFNL